MRWARETTSRARRCIRGQDPGQQVPGGTACTRSRTAARYLHGK